MKKTLRIAVALSALALAFPAAAQQAKRTTVGLGISVEPFADASGVLPVTEVYLPLQLTPQFRLEPSLGIFTNDPSGGGVETSNVTFGVGAFFVNRVAEPVDMYVGGRLKLNFASFDDGVDDDSDTDLVLAAALGGEYYFVPRFSLGLEGQLGLYDRGDVSGDDSGFFTTGLAFLRMYF